MRPRSGIQINPAIQPTYRSQGLCYPEHILQMGKSAGETNALLPTPGQRTELVLPRGIYSSPGIGASQWLQYIEKALDYCFQNPDLLEEALESPESGITCVGISHRHLDDGNIGFSVVGEAAMKLVLKDQCYVFQIPPGSSFTPS